MSRLSLIAFAAAFGCASSNVAPGSAGSETARVIASNSQGGMQAISVGAPIAGASMVTASVAKVWNAIPAVYDSLGIPPGMVEPASHMYGNRGLQVRRQLGKVRLSKYIDCGSAQARPSADFYDVNLSVVTELQPADSANTKVVTTVDAMARPVAFAGEYVRCATTGEIESRISNMLQTAATR